MKFPSFFKQALSIVTPALGLLASLSPVRAAHWSQQYGIMPMNSQLLGLWQSELEEMPDYEAPSGYPNNPGSVNLLDHLNYSASDRNQGHTGTCWIWGCQAVMSIDYAIQHPGLPLLTNGFSVQFVASNLRMVDASYQSGGTPNTFRRFHEAVGYGIPWCNPGAAWTDADGGMKTPSSWIFTQPNIPITRITVSDIITTNADPAIAIANIKSALDAGRAVWFNITLANDEDWGVFCSFWGKTNATEDVIIDPAYGKGHTFLDDEGGSHIMAIVGYNDLDSDPAKHYWIVLNSWGNADGKRPNGLFHMAMHTEYNAQLLFGLEKAYMFEFGLLETEFATKVHHGIESVALDLQSAASSANSIQINGVSFSPASAPTNVIWLENLHLEINGCDFNCGSGNGAWSSVSNGFHFESASGKIPGIRMDIDTVACKWWLSISSADECRYIDAHNGFYFSAEYFVQETNTLSLGGLRALMFDEMTSRAAARFTNSPPGSPLLSLKVAGQQATLRIDGETGSTCLVQETPSLGATWTLRATVPMTGPVKEVTLPAPASTNLFWRVQAQ